MSATSSFLRIPRASACLSASNITATSSNNISSSCIVTVKAVEVSSITLSDVSLAVGESQTLHAVISPSNATNQSITWSIDDESVATINPTLGKIVLYEICRFSNWIS